MGALSLASAIKVAYFRGAAAQELADDPVKNGTMLAVGMSPEDFERCSHEYPPHIQKERFSISCINSDRNITISGDQEAIDMLERKLTSQSIFARKLTTGVAYHSPQMECLATKYRNSLGSLQSGKPVTRGIIMVSTVSGSVVEDVRTLTDSDYWIRNMLQPVLFAKSLDEVLMFTGLSTKLGRRRPFCTDITEIGPHPALQRPVLDGLEKHGKKSTISYHASLERSTSAVKGIMKLAGRMTCRGHVVDLEAVNQVGLHGRPKCLPNLPQYPFNHSHRYWHESRAGNGIRFPKYPEFVLLGRPVPEFNPLEAKWRKLLRLEFMPWLKDHQVECAY